MNAFPPGCASSSASVPSLPNLCVDGVQFEAWGRAPVHDHPFFHTFIQASHWIMTNEISFGPEKNRSYKLVGPFHTRMHETGHAHADTVHHRTCSTTSPIACVHA